MDEIDVSRQENPGQGVAPFLSLLFTEGRAVVSPNPPLPLDDVARQLLTEQETALRLEMAYEAPSLSLSAASWATTLLYEACRFVVCRDLGEAELVRALKNPCPEARSASVDWSVDLLLHRLPAVYKQARHLSYGDPLVRELRFLGVSWPLSSVGIPDLEGFDLEPILSNPSLAQLYVDRIIAYREVSRLSDPRVASLVQQALGAHPELAPELSRYLLKAKGKVEQAD